ncbi:MAG: prolipoprotein diacylglyceryl transferase [Planctomycetota bacterium]
MLQETATDLGGWLHDLGPYVFRLPNGFGPKWYGVSYMIGFVLAWFGLKQLAKRDLIAIPVDRVTDAIMLVVMGVLIGGRLGYCVFYRPSLLIDFSPMVLFGAEVPMWGAVKVWDGGMASHGGLIGVIVAAWWISRGFKTEDGERVGVCPPLHVADALALVAPFGLFLGRIANFINGELLGKVIAHPGDRVAGFHRYVAVRYPQEHLDPGHAPELTVEQQIEMARLLNEFVPTDEPFGIRYEKLLGMLQRGVPGIEERLAPLVSARLASQLVQALAEGVIVALVVWFVARRPRRPGLVGGWFLISYGVLRVLTEFVRLPDTHLANARPLGLTRGQWLSAVMVLAGAGLVIYASRSAGRRFLGWAGSAQAGEAEGQPEADSDQAE